MKAKFDISDFLKDLGYNQRQVNLVSKSIAQFDKDTCFRDRKTKIKEIFQNGMPLLMAYPDQIISSKESSINILNNFLLQYFPEMPIYLLPCWEATGDGDFSIKDYQTPRPSVGTTQDLIDFFNKRPVCLDIVFSYVSIDHKNVINYFNSPPSHAGFIAEFISNKHLKEIPKSHRGHPNITKYRSKFGDRYIWTTFSTNQANLNYSSPETLIWLLETLKYYIDLGITTIRLDAVGFTWTDETGPHVHAPQCHTLVKIIRSFVNYYHPSITILAQADYISKPFHDYIGSQDDQAHLMYRYEFSPILLHALLSKQKRFIEQWIIDMANDDGNWISFLGTHDGVFLRPWKYPLPKDALQLLVDACVSNGGEVQYYDIETDPKPATLCSTTYSLLHYGVNDDNTIKRLILAHAILLSLPGVPALYFNSLLGMKNWDNWITLEDNPRSIIRERYSEKLINHLMSSPDSTQNILYESIKLLIKVRIKHEAIGQHSQIVLLSELPDSILGWMVKNNDKIAFCYFNIGDETEEINIKSNCGNLLGEPIVKDVIKLTPLSYSWVELL